MTSRDTYDIKKYGIEKIIERMQQIAAWHAKEQVNFYHELAKDEDFDESK